MGQRSSTTWLCAALALGSLAARAAGEDAAERQPPNFLLIVADDLGWTDLGCFGSSFYETPALDRLARQGTSFTDAYAACPVCSPTRASLFSGKYPARLGLTDHSGAPQPTNWNWPTRLRGAPFKTYLPLEEATLAEALRAVGYATFFGGKWHLGHTDQYWPEYQGFDVNVGGCASGGPFAGNQYFSPYGNPRLSDGPPGEHLDDRLAAETIRFIESRRRRPFFASLCFYSVHVPLVPREDLRQKYERKRNPFGETPTPIYGFDGETRVRLIQEHAVYAAMVESMDQAVGRVLGALDALGLADNTIVMFTSDNGGLSTGDRAISPDQGWPTSNAPLRAGKGWLYEGGVRVPLIVRGPGVRAGAKSDHIVTSTDYYPTLLELAGLPPASQQHVDGRSFASALAGETAQREAVYWHYPHYGNQGGRPGSAVRSGDWKLIHWFEDDRVELYRLSDDLGEQHDLANTDRGQAAQLKSQLDQWREAVGAVMPTHNPAYDEDLADARGKSE